MIGVPGYRSKNKYKMILASFVYALVIMIVVIAIINPSSSDEVNADQNTPEWQQSFKDIAIGEAERYIELTEKNGKLPLDRLVESSTVIKQQADKLTSGKDEFLKLADLVEKDKLSEVKAMLELLEK